MIALNLAGLRALGYYRRASRMPLWLLLPAVAIAAFGVAWIVFGALSLVFSDAHAALIGAGVEP